MITKEIAHFDLSEICDSGQCFRMERLSETRFTMIAGERYLEVSQEGQTVAFDCTEEAFEEFWKNYFDLDADYGAYIAAIDPKDTYLSEAASLGGGVRILRQDLWEMIISFLISQQNNIVRIRRCIDNISARYGERRVSDNGTVYYAFPTAEKLSQATEEELRECNLGYRAKYVLDTAKKVASGEVSLDAIQEMPYPKAKEELLKLYGVGEKVADCICLFALHHLSAFPVDTHIRQALESHYQNGFPKERYEGIEGVVQQYIFYYELIKPREIY